MIGTNISFAKEKNGYDIEQVNSYIKKIGEAYQTTYYEFLDISGKYKSLLEDCGNSDKKEPTGMNPDVAAKTLINTEMLAQKIISEAQAEATAAVAESRRIKDSADAEISKAKEAAQKIIDEAYAEAAKARADAQKITNDAQNEADLLVARVRVDIERARRIMGKASGEAEKLLTSFMYENENDAAA